MLKKPILAKCNDRDKYARKHPSSGEPEEWLCDSYLEPYGLFGLTFDFFVNWKESTIPNQLWMKRIVEESFMPWPITRWRDTIPSEIYQCDREDKVRQLCRFADKYGMSCRYFLIKDSSDFSNPSAPIIKVSLKADSSVKRVRNIDLTKLENKIKKLRGGPASIGSKGLTYALSSLECHLSKTDTIWPGDADLVLVDSSLTPHAIIEFKKHTSGSNIAYANQKLSNYYPRKDSRKYDSFAHLRDRFINGIETLPIIVVYYSIEIDYDYVMLELIEGAAGNLRAVTDLVAIPLPNASDEQSCRKFVASLLGMINYKT